MTADAAARAPGSQRPIAYFDTPEDAACALQGLARTQGAKAPPSALVVCPASAAGRFPRRRGPVLGQGGDWALVRVAVR